MNVKQGKIIAAAFPCQYFFHRFKRAGKGLHKCRSADIDAKQTIAAAIENAVAAAGTGGGIVGGAQRTGLALQILIKAALLEGMIAAGEHIGAGCKQRAGGFGVGAVARRGIFRIDDDKIGGILLPQRPEIFFEIINGSGADDIPDA